MKITDAEIRRMSNMEPEEQYKYLQKFDATALERITRRAAEMQGQSILAEKEKEAQRFSEVAETASFLFPKKKYPDAVILLLLIIFLASCSIPRRPVHEGNTKELVTSVQKYSVITIASSKHSYTVPGDTIKVGDVIDVSWINKKK